MNKICTSHEQSKKLIELGIDRNTADMYYPNRVGMDNYALSIEWKNGLQLLSQEIPAWSLSALMELMPLINEYNIEYRPIIERHADDGWACKYYNEETRNTNDIYIRRFGRTPLDAAFQMICWLKKNNKI